MSTKSRPGAPGSSSSGKAVHGARHRARRLALQFLYRREMEANGKPDLEPPTPIQIVSELKSHFAHFEAPDDLREFASQLASGTLLEQKTLDERLSPLTQNWRLSRMPIVDRCLLRMGAYELIHLSSSATPPAVIIDQTLELAKEFSTEESGSFLNGVLDSLRKSLLT